VHERQDRRLDPGEEVELENERERQTVESIARGQAVDVDDEITVAK